MKRDKLISYINKRFEEILAAFERIMIDLGKAECETREHFESEDIHCFRVETKKLRAFLHLVLPDHHPTLSEPLHGFYHSLGVIRNLQLQQIRIRDRAGRKPQRIAGYLELLHREMEVAAGQALAEGRQLFLPHEEQRIIDRLPEELDTRTIHEFLWRMDTRIRALTRPDASLDDDNLHALRKCLKDLAYVHHLLPPEAAHILPPSMVAGSEKLEPFLKVLGQLQDLRSGLEWLKPSVIGIIPDDREQKLLTAVRHKWEKERGHLRHQYSVLYLPIFHRVFAVRHPQ